MADYCNEEIDAVECEFSGLFVFRQKGGNFGYCYKRFFKIYMVKTLNGKLSPKQIS